MACLSCIKSLLCCFGPQLDAISTTSSVDYQNNFETSLKTLSRKVCAFAFDLTSDKPVPFASLAQTYANLKEVCDIFHEVIESRWLEEEDSEQVVPIRADEGIPLRRNRNYSNLIKKIEKSFLYKSSFEERCGFYVTINLEEQIRRVHQVALKVLFTMGSKITYAKYKNAEKEFAGSPFFLTSFGHKYLQTILMDGNAEERLNLCSLVEKTGCRSSVDLLTIGRLNLVEKQVNSVDFNNLHEVAALSNLNHPNIVSFGAVSKMDASFSYTLLYANQESLCTVEEEGFEFSYSNILNWFKGYLNALKYIHDRGFVHADLKPENLLIHDGEGMVADFESLERIGNKIAGGTYHYLSPEALREGVSYAESDMWSLGLVLFYLLFEEDFCTLDIPEEIEKEEILFLLKNWYERAQGAKGGFEHFVKERMQECMQNQEVCERISFVDPDGFLRKWMQKLLRFEKEERPTAENLHKVFDEQYIQIKRQNSIEQ